MSKIVLALLLGALCASAWWAFARWPDFNNGLLIAPAIFSSIGIGVWVAYESVKVNYE